ncbi:MAG TPA: hypothetical protein VHA73_10125 [Acidimicrobiales bacterium]|jgi:hypothetical protein|nr:hypothetical protein [Acidimicrobiales bacterium]
MEGAHERRSEEQPGRWPEQLPEQLTVTPWRDEVVEAHGYGPRSMYVEVCWLPTLGPSSTWLYRRLGSWAEFNPDGVQVDTADLAASLGLGQGLGRHSLLSRTVDRLIRFEAARWAGSDLQVRTALGALPLKLAGRLSPTALSFHEQMLRRPGNSIPGRSA